MEFSRPNQFWQWFQRSQFAYTNFFTLPENDQGYLLRELHMHLAACGKHIEAELFMRPGGRKKHILVLTTRGRARYFGKVERLVAQAPSMPDWSFYDLFPPNEFEAVAVQDFAKHGFARFNGSFLPFRLVTHDNNTMTVRIFVDTQEEITGKHELAIKTAVFSILGEKVYGLKIWDVEVARLADLPRAHHPKLVNIRYLPRYIQVIVHSRNYIDEFGNVKCQKR